MYWNQILVKVRDDEMRMKNKRDSPIIRSGTVSGRVESQRGKVPNVS